MNNWIRAVFVAMLIASTGCIEQEVKIKLNADGSGRIEVVRNLSELESAAILAGETNAIEFQTMTIKRTTGDSETQPSRKVERSVYTFGNLAEALPELENAVPMMPRFTIRGDRLVVFLCHEMNPYHGFSSNDETNSFYRIEIEFPSAPLSDTGIVEGNRVKWSANHDQLTAFQKSEIGTLAFECSVPASAIALDVKPRLVTYEKKASTSFGREREPKLISGLNVNIPIVGSNAMGKEGQNGTLEVYLPVDLSALPLCYENLRIDQLNIDGQCVDATIESTPSGVFFGTDQWGREAPGLPVKLRFGWNSNVLKTIDSIQVSMEAAEPTRLSSHTLQVDASNSTNSVLSFEEPAGQRFAVLDVKHAASQTAVLKVATNLKPSELSMVYLDTNYGLRYPAKGMRWKSGSQVHGSDKEGGDALFGKEAPYSIVEIHYPHIPKTMFSLKCSRVEEKTMTKRTLVTENIHVN